MFLLAAIATSTLFWLIPIALAPDRTPSTLVVFRPGGDPDYLPTIAAAADLKLGETSVKEYAGTGVHSFPLVPLILHAALERLAGSAGLMLADVVVIFLYACALRYFLLRTGMERWAAELLSLAVASGTAAAAADKILSVAHVPHFIRFWIERFPRPFVTELVMVLFLVLAMAIVAQPKSPGRTYALFGIALAMLFQSDIYEAFTAALVLGAVSVAACAAIGLREALARLAAMSLAFVVGSVPFVYQQLHASADVKRRWGAFATHHYAQLLPDAAAGAAAAIALVIAAILARRFRSSPRGGERLSALTVCSAAVGASVIAGPLSLAALHQTIQPLHFRETVARMIGYAVLLYAGWLLSDFLRQRTLQVAAIALAFLAWGVFAVRASIREGLSREPTMWMPNRGESNLLRYEIDFPELRRALEKPGRNQPMVLGTFDVQLASWWQLRRGYVFLPDLFNSTVADQVVESRVFEFLRRVGSGPEDFARLLDDQYFITRVIGSEKYQVNVLFTPWPIEEYSPQSRQKIAKGNETFEIPRSEKIRLIKGFKEAPADPSIELDAIVFDKSYLRAYVHPERMTNLRLILSNRTFEAWAPINP